MENIDNFKYNIICKFSCSNRYLLNKKKINYFLTLSVFERNDVFYLMPFKYPSNPPSTQNKRTQYPSVIIIYYLYILIYSVASSYFFFFSHSDFRRWTKANAIIYHDTDDVQIGGDHHAVDRFGSAHPQGCDHQRDTAYHSLDRFSGQVVQVPQSLHVTDAFGFVMVGGIPLRSLRPFIATAIAATITG